jgi:hypothetical protein
MTQKFDPNAPHQAVILVRVENCSRLPDGQNSNRVSRSRSEVVSFEGKDFAEVEDKVNQFIKRMKDAEATINESQTQGS